VCPPRKSLEGAALVAAGWDALPAGVPAGGQGRVLAPAPGLDYFVGPFGPSFRFCFYIAK